MFIPVCYRKLTEWKYGAEISAAFSKIKHYGLKKDFNELIYSFCPNIERVEQRKLKKMDDKKKGEKIYPS